MTHDDIASAPEGASDECLADFDASKTVYIREVGASDILSDLRAVHGEDAEIELPTDGPFYAVHTVDGERIAVLGDREAAFVAARQHEMEPVSVH
ncbi:MAG: DUF1150 family protein [Pseudomonadota bacterium]